MIEMARKTRQEHIVENTKMYAKLFIYAFFFAVVFIAGTSLVLYIWFMTNFRSFYYMGGSGSQFCIGMLMLMFPVVLAYYFTEPIKKLIKLKIMN